nr:MAG TPA_asm: hypothetical protein [Caudoviricetes sp.]
MKRCSVRECLDVSKRIYQPHPGHHAGRKESK